MLGVVGSNLKMVKFFMQHLWMLHDVVVIWACVLVRFSTRNMSQHIATGWPNACSMLRQQCCDLLRSNVAIVWLELANAGPTMLGCVALSCCYRLAGALVLGLTEKI